MRLTRKQRFWIVFFTIFLAFCISVLLYMLISGYYGSLLIVITACLVSGIASSIGFSRTIRYDRDER